MIGFGDTTTLTRYRLTSLDVFRGLAVIAMIIVSNQGDYDHAFAQVVHAEWDDIRFADIVFPSFLFTVGLSLAAALRPYLATTPVDEGGRRPDRALYLKLCRRALVLVVLGLLINGFPEFQFETWRVTGILQRIGVCYLIAALIMLHVPLRWQLELGAAILVLYSAILHFVGAPGVAPGQLEPTTNLPRWLDLAVFSRSHLFHAWPTEPEGLLSTLPAIVSVLLGGWVGLGVTNQLPAWRRGALIIAAGLALATLGMTGSTILPMVKMIWTPTFTLFSGGCAMVCYGLIYLLCDAMTAPKSIWVMQVFGRNAILAYVLSELGAKALPYLRVNGTSIPDLVSAAITSLEGTPVPAEIGSLIYACLYVVAMWVVLYIPYRRGWFIRI